MRTKLTTAGEKEPIHPDIWVVLHDRLFLNGDVSKQENWMDGVEENIEVADQQ